MEFTSSDAPSQEMVSQLVACPTTQEEVIAEVDRTYGMIVIIEKKCVKVHLEQAQLADEALLGVQPEIHFAYPMMNLLLETVPAFESMWFECLGDLSRYRLGIESHDPSSIIVWAEIARQWYLKSANYAPVIGRLYYHLGSIGRPDPLLQLFYAGKTLAVPNHFTAARMLIARVFEANLNIVASKISFSVAIAAIVRAHAIIFTGHSLNTFDES